MVENKTRYEFECLECHHAFSQVWIFQDEGLTCPRCGSQYNKVISKTEEEPEVVKSDVTEVLIPADIKDKFADPEKDERYRVGIAAVIGGIVLTQLSKTTIPVIVKWKEGE